MVCPNCQAACPADASYCSTCGAALRPAATGPTRRLRDPDAAERPPWQLSLRDGSCPKCGASEIVKDRPIRDYGYAQNYDLQIIQAERPQALIFTGEQVVSVLRAWVCGACGFTELYATNHAKLLDLYRRSR